MYSPAQEVPSTPLLRHGFDHFTIPARSPDAVVPNQRINNTQESYSVPGTPIEALSPSPWTPGLRSLVRSSSPSSSRRYIYQPSLYFQSPVAAPSPKEQVVPGTPKGAFVPPSAATTPTRRHDSPFPRHAAVNRLQNEAVIYGHPRTSTRQFTENRPVYLSPLSRQILSSPATPTRVLPSTPRGAAHRLSSPQSARRNPRSTTTPTALLKSPVLAKVMQSAGTPQNASQNVNVVVIGPSGDNNTNEAGYHSRARKKRSSGNGSGKRLYNIDDHSSSQNQPRTVASTTTATTQTLSASGDSSDWLDSI